MLKMIEVIEGKVKQLESDATTHQGVFAKLTNDAKVAQDTANVISGAIQAYKAVIQAMKDEAAKSNESSLIKVPPIQGEVISE